MKRVLLCVLILIACIAAFAFQAPEVDPQKTWAVVIGISHYQNFAPLRFAANDAKSIEEFLTSPRGGGILPDHIFPLYEGDASQAGIIDHLEMIADKVQPGDTVYIYIAGHGYLNRNIGYYVPAEASPDRIGKGAISFGYLKELVENNLVQARVRVLWTDICNSGRIGVEQTDVARQIGNILNGQLRNFKAGSGTFLNLLASEPSEASYESDELGQGVFTYYLLDALNGKAGSGNGVIDAKSVVDYVHEQVPLYTGMRQTPVFNPDFDPKLPLAFSNRPGPMRPMDTRVSLVIRNANRAMLGRVEWFDNRFRAKAVRALPKEDDTVEIESLPAGTLHLQFVNMDNMSRKLHLELKPGQNTVDILKSNLTRYRFTPGTVQVAALGAPPLAPSPQAQIAGAAVSADLMVRLAAGNAVTIDGVPWGNADAPDQYLWLAGIAPGTHVLAITAGTDREYRFRLRLFAGMQIFDLDTGELKYVLSGKPDPAQIPIPAGVPAAQTATYRQFVQAIFEERLILPAGNSAWDYYLQLQNAVTPAARREIEGRLAVAMGDRAQRTILKYLRGGDIRWNAATFDEGATLVNRTRQLLRTYPGLDSEEAFFQGRASIERAQYAQAVTQLQRAVMLDADASHAQNAIGLALWRQGQLDRAVAPLQQAIALSPQWPYPRNTLALIYLEQRRYNEAETQFQQTVAIRNEDSSAHHGLGQIYLLTNRLAESEAQIQQAINFNPGNAYAYQTYGRLEQRRGNLANAEQMYRLAIRLEPDEPAFHISLADLLRQQGRIPDAQNSFGRAAALSPASLPMVQSYSAFLVSQNRGAEGKALFEKAIKAADKDSNLRVMYATFLKTQKNTKDAEKELKTAIQLSDANPYAHYELATLYLEQKKVAPAKTELDLAAKADPRFPATPKLQGQIAIAEKNYDVAVQQLEKAKSVAIDAGQIQEIDGLLATARKNLTKKKVDVAKAGKPSETWTGYADALRQNPEDRTARDAILKFALEQPAAADVSKLPASPIADALKTNFWREVQRAEQLWTQKNRAQAEDVFVAAVENLTDAERRIVTATPLNIRNADASVHEIVYRWASRMIEDNNAARAITLLESSIRRNIFGVVPNVSAVTLDSLMWPADVETPKTFSDYEVAFHPDRRAHEVFVTAYLMAGDAAKAREYLAAVDHAATPAIRLANETLSKRPTLSADDIKKFREALQKLKKSK